MKRGNINYSSLPSSILRCLKLIQSDECNVVKYTEYLQQANIFHINLGYNQMKPKESHSTIMSSNYALFISKRVAYFRNNLRMFNDLL